MIERVAASAPLVPPLTGASSTPMPRPAARSAICRTIIGVAVLSSISVPPSGRAESTPRSPRTAAAISASAGRQVRTTSLAAATAAGSATRRPPASTKVLAAASRRVQKVSS